MQIQQTESLTFFNYITKPVFAYEAYFSVRVTLGVDSFGEKIFQFHIKVVPLKTTSIDLELSLHVSTSGITIGQEIVKIQNHDGSEYETRNYDFSPCNQFKIVLGGIKITEYDEKNYETLTFNVALPSKNTYHESGIVSGDYRWYKNSSSKRKLKGKGSDGWFW